MTVRLLHFPRLFISAAIACGGAGCEEQPRSPRPPAPPRTAEPSPALPPIPEFPLDTLEPAVREQITAALAKVERRPRDAEKAGRLGMLFHAYEIFPQARACYRRATVLAPGDTRWHYYFGLVLAATGESAEAAEQFDIVLTADRDAVPVLVERANADIVLGDYQDALNRFDAAVHLNPDCAPAHYGAARALMKLDREAEAIERLHRALTIAPQYGKARYVLAQALRKTGQVEQAREQLALAEQQKDAEPVTDEALAKELASLTTGGIDALHRAVDLLQERRVDEAIELLEQALAEKPELAEVHANLGTAWLLKGDAKRAEDFLRRALELQPGYAQAHYNLGLIAYRRRQWSEAVARFQNTIATDEQDFDAHLALGRTLSKLGRPREAETHLRTALRLDPGDKRPYKSLETLLTQQQDYAAAIDIMRQAVNRFPHDATLLNRLAWLLATSPRAADRRPDEAVRLAREACELTSFEIPQPMDTLAAAYAADGRFGGAVAMAQRAREAALAAGDGSLAREIESRLAQYRAHEPYRVVAVPPSE